MDLIFLSRCLDKYLLKLYSRIIVLLKTEKIGEKRRILSVYLGIKSFGESICKVYKILMIKGIKTVEKDIKTRYTVI